MGLVLIRLNKFNDAITHLEKLLILYEKLKGKSKVYALCLNEIGYSYVCTQRGKQAIQYSENALSIFENLLGKDSTEYI